MSWFERLTGFEEQSPYQVREKLSVEDEMLTSHVNGTSYACGRLVLPSLQELRERVAAAEHVQGALSLREVVADVADLHAHPANAGCLFQVASQFNLLEMVGPGVTPEEGVGIYEHDPTQGPACAIACGAGTIYRNYFAEVNGTVGQSADNQIDCLADFGAALGNDDGRLWEMRNGYALPSHEGLVETDARLGAASEDQLDELRRLLRIGVQWDTQVTIRNCSQTVTQAYCSALPVAYSNQPGDLWQRSARLVLEAAYEATLCVAILNAVKTGNNRVFLTLLGGGAFGNRTEWIIDALARALGLYRDWDLDVAVVSYGRSQECVAELVDT